jgi:hypothetical protein
MGGSLQTMAFTTLVLFSLFTAFQRARSDERSTFLGLFSSQWL